MFEGVAKWVAKRALKYAGVPLRDPALVAMFGRNESSSGIDVTEESAMSCGAVFSAINLISSAVASLPKHVYMRQAAEGSDGVNADHNVERLFANPNPYMTDYVFTETLQGHASSHGNGYAFIERDGNSFPSALWPINPCKVTVHGADDGETWYAVHEGTEHEKWIDYRDMLHIPGMGFDGRKGYSVIALAREAIGLGMASENYGAAFFGNGATPRLALSHPGELGAKARRNLAKSWKDIYSNATNPHAVALLDEGMTVTTIGLPPEDSQFLQTRQFQVVEIARWFRVPPHLLYDLTGSTFNNVEQQNLNFLTYTLIPWLTRWRQECARKLFKLNDYKDHYIDFDTSALLMTDIVTRYNAYNTGRNGGWLTLNAINRKERLPLLPAAVGDVHLAPSTMKVLGQNDPTTPIPVETITATVDAIKGLGRSVPDALARDLLNAAMPSASEQLVTRLIAYLIAEGCVKNVAA